MSMSNIPSGIFAKKHCFKKQYVKEIESPHDVDKDEDIQKDIARLEKLASIIRHNANRCEITGSFFDDVKTIGGLHNRYSEHIPLPEDSRSHKRLLDAMKIVDFAKKVFIRDCECKFKRKLY